MKATELRKKKVRETGKEESYISDQVNDDDELVNWLWLPEKESFAHATYYGRASILRRSYLVAPCITINCAFSDSYCVLPIPVNDRNYGTFLNLEH